MDRVLDRFAGLEEARERAHSPRRGGGVVGEQDRGPALYQHHHRGRDARIGGLAASRAFHRALALRALHRARARAAEAMGACPFSDLVGTPGDRKELVVDAIPELA